MKNKRAIIISIAIFFLFALIITLTIKKHITKNETVSKIVVKNGLSINYLDGDSINAGVKEKKYTFSITNDTDTEKYYQIDIEDFKPNSKIEYNLQCEESKLELLDKVFDTDKLIDYAVINPHETHNYTLSVKKSASKTKIGTLSVNLYVFEQEYFAQTVISNSSVSQNTQSVVGVDISQSDEGLIQDLDDDGVTYYFRGNVKNNYVKFADMMWRIVRVNGNNTVRLVLDGQVDELTEYYTSNNSNYFAYVNTNLKSSLSSWYNANLSNYDKYIVNNKLCDNTSYTGTDEYIFAANQRLTVNNNPTFNCLGSKINSKIFVLTADEVVYAGGLIGVGNQNYYLYNSSIGNPSWTITPAKGNKNEFYPYVLSTSGSLDDSLVGTSKGGIRPVINIRKDLSVTGKGTYEEPYEILF